MYSQTYTRTHTHTHTIIIITHTRTHTHLHKCTHIYMHSHVCMNDTLIASINVFTHNLSFSPPLPPSHPSSFPRYV